MEAFFMLCIGFLFLICHSYNLVTSVWLVCDQFLLGICDDMGRADGAHFYVHNFTFK